MPDPADPSQPASTPPDPVPQPSSTAQAAPLPMADADAGSKSTTTGLPSNVAAALACFPLIGGIVFYLLEKTDGFVRFYAMQSIIFGSVWFLFSLASSIIGGLFGTIAGFLELLWNIAAFFVQISFFVILIIAMVKAFTGVRWDIPYIGPLARKQMDGGGVL